MIKETERLLKTAIMYTFHMFHLAYFKSLSMKVLLKGQLICTFKENLTKSDK